MALAFGDGAAARKKCCEEEVAALVFGWKFDVVKLKGWRGGGGLLAGDRWGCFGGTGGLGWRVRGEGGRKGWQGGGDNCVCEACEWEGKWREAVCEKAKVCVALRVRLFVRLGGKGGS